MSVGRAEAKSWARERIQGLWTSPMIPIADDGTLDEDGIRANVEHLIALRVSGLGFGFSEPWYLRLEERKTAFRVFVESVGGRIPCYCHALDYSVPETIDLVRFAEEIGADAVMLWTPLEFAKTEEQMCEWFEYVASEVSTPIIAYNTYHSGRSLSIDTIERIAAIENVCALKDAVNDFGHTVEAMQVVGDQIVVSNPLEKHLPAMKMYMNQQVMLGTTSLFLMQSPASQPIQDYVDLIEADRFAEAWQAYYALDPLRQLWNDVYEVLWQKDGALHPIATIKYWMDLLGMPRRRRPTADASNRRPRKLVIRQRIEESGWMDTLFPDGFAVQ